MAEKVDIDKILQHEIYLHRLNSGMINSTVATGLEEAYQAIRMLLLDKGVPVTPRQLSKLEASIAIAIRDNSPWSIYTDELEGVAIYEAGYTGNQLAQIATVKTVADSRIIRFVNDQFMEMESGGKVQSGLWGQFAKANDDAETRLVLDLIRTSYAREETVYQAGKRIREAYAGTLKSNAESLARTGFAHYTNQSRAAWANGNADLDLMAHAVFTFDNRISDTCKFLSTQQTVWEPNDPKRPQFPAHWRCRSLYVWLPRGTELQGTRASVGGQSGKEAEEAFDKRKSRTDKKVKYRGKRDSNVFKPGQVRADTSVESWLRRQPAWFIDDTLGVAKGKLFRSGDKLSSFYDVTGKPLTIEQLITKDGG